MSTQAAPYRLLKAEKPKKINESELVIEPTDRFCSKECKNDNL